MIRYLIKNNFKLMSRNKWVMAILILGPVLVIAVLSSAFQSLMKSYEAVDAFKVGYSIEENSVFADYMDTIKEAGEDAGITFLEYPDEDVKKTIENNDLAGFAVFGEEEYIVYESADFVTEGITLEYFLSEVMDESKNQVLQTIVPQLEEEEMVLPVKELDYMPAINSTDYYGIVYIVYFIWCCIVCAAGVLQSEKRNGIDRRFQVTPVANIKLYFAKWIPIVLVTAVEMGIAIVVCAIMFDIHWGNLMMSGLILLLAVMAGTAFGLMLYYLFQNLAVTIVALFMIVWFMGFFGGSFETYMFSPWSDSLKNMSPIYHLNRVLVEYSCMGHSTYTKSSILYMLAIIIGCSLVAIIVDGIRKRGKA